MANGRFVGSIPYGPYHPLYLKDQQMKLIEQRDKNEIQKTVEPIKEHAAN
mgnify:CR=1 FL=1